MLWSLPGVSILSPLTPCISPPLLYFSSPFSSLICSALLSLIPYFPLYFLCRFSFIERILLQVVNFIRRSILLPPSSSIFKSFFRYIFPSHSCSILTLTHSSRILRRQAHQKGLYRALLQGSQEQQGPCLRHRHTRSFDPSRHGYQEEDSRQQGPPQAQEGYHQLRL